MSTFTPSLDIFDECDFGDEESADFEIEIEDGRKFLGNLHVEIPRKSYSVKVPPHTQSLVTKKMSTYAAYDGSDTSEISMKINRAPDQEQIFQMVFACLRDNSELPSNVAEYAYV